MGQLMQQGSKFGKLEDTHDGQRERKHGTRREVATQAWSYNLTFIKKTWFTYLTKNGGAINWSPSHTYIIERKETTQKNLKTYPIQTPIHVICVERSQYFVFLIKFSWTAPVVPSLFLRPYVFIHAGLRDQLFSIFPYTGLQLQPQPTPRDLD